MLTTIDLNDEMRCVTSEVDDVPLDANLPAEMRIADGQTMTLGFSRALSTLYWVRDLK